MSDTWDFYQCQVESKPASIFVDLGLRDQVPMAAFPDMVYLRLFLRNPTAHGMTTSEEADILYPYEDVLSKAAMDNDAVYVGRVTTAGFRDFVFYAVSGALLDPVIASTAATFKGYQFETGSRADSEWTIYRDYLYPTGRVLQIMKNRGMYDALRENGDALTAIREVDHWVYFLEASSRELFAQNCQKEGFEVRSMRETDDEARKFEIVVFRRDVPSAEGFDDVTVMLFDLAEAAGGYYDGWETPVLQN